MNISLVRQQIPASLNYTYLNTGWSGPSPQSVVQAITDRLTLEMEHGPTTAHVHESGQLIKEETKVAIASLINADPREVTITKNTTEGLNHVINGIDWETGDEIITCNLEHGSVLTPSHFQSLRHGVHVRIVDLLPDESVENIVNKFSNAFSERTRLVFISHIEYSSGLRMPVKEIRTLAQQAGAMVLIDGAQSAGHIPLDMQDLGVEFYSIPGQKWLLGPEATGALYIRTDLIERISPMSVSGKATLNDHNPYGIEVVVDTIEKFQLTSTNVALHSGLLEAVNFISNIGVKNISERNLSLASRLKTGLSQIKGVNVLSPYTPENSSGLVSFTLSNISAAEAVSTLWEKYRIVCRSVAYPECIRASMHFFNTYEEADKLLNSIEYLNNAI